MENLVKKATKINLFVMFISCFPVVAKGPWKHPKTPQTTFLTPEFVFVIVSIIEEQI